MTTFLVTIGIGLSTAAILSLSAVAFTLEYAVSRIANFAHGEFLTIGHLVSRPLPPEGALGYGRDDGLAPQHPGRRCHRG